jgi:hypothetical protein
MALIGTHAHSKGGAMQAQVEVTSGQKEPNFAGEAPVVRLKNGTLASRYNVKRVMATLGEMQTKMENGAILINDLVMKCRDDEHHYFDGCERMLFELSFVDADGDVVPSVRDIVLSAMKGEGEDLSFISPIAD